MSRRKKLPPVVWGFQDGQTIVVHASARWARDLPAVRIHGLWHTVNEMGRCVDAFRAAKGLPDRTWDLMMSMTATVACELMEQAADDMRAILALSPSLREIVARVDAGRKQTPRHLGGSA